MTEMSFKNYGEFLAKAKMVLKEHAGSEGFAYLLKYKGELKEEGFKVEDKEDGKAKIVFDIPHDYGFALQTLKDLGVEVIGLELLN
jgi:hypothetical protein